MTPGGPILLAEDNPDDVLLIRLGFKKAGCDRPVIVVSDGEQALNYLKGEGQYEDRARFPVPCLLLLDLRLPRIDGFEVLAWVRSKPQWKCLPIIVLTTSHYGKDIERAYDLGANSFLTKPTDAGEWMNALEQTVGFWLRSSSLPEPGPFIPLPKIALSGPGNPSGLGRRSSTSSKPPRRSKPGISRRPRSKGGSSFSE